MNITFDSANIGQSEARALIAFLNALHQTAQPPVSTPALPPAPGPQLVETTQPQTQPEPEPAARRGRKPRAEATPEPAQEIPSEASQPSDVEAGSPTSAAKTVSADELRALLNNYIQKHSMEDAIAKLRSFGCNRVTEALALGPDKLNELAAALNG